MGLLDNITHIATAKAHRPWPRAVVTEDGWGQAIDQLAIGHCTLLGLWGDEPEVHMALLNEASGDVAVVSYTCKSGKYPSVAARHPPAVRLERAIRDLFGLDAVDTFDARPWLDLGFWNVRHPLGKKGPARKPVPYKFLPAEGEALHPSEGGYFGPGNAQLPAPPMLMMDRITEISLNGGQFGKGHIVGELDIVPEHWFFDCHYRGDAMMPGSLGLDAMGQMVGYWLGWSGSPGKGRAIGVGEVEVTGAITPETRSCALRGRHAHGPPRQAGARNCRWPRACRRRRCRSWRRISGLDRPRPRTEVS